MRRATHTITTLTLAVATAAAALTTTSSASTADPARSASSARVAADRPITPAKIGKARIGMTVDEAMATGQFKQDVPNPPCDPIELQPTKPYTHQYVVLVADDRIVEMDAYGGDMHTSTDARVYSTYKRVQHDYGDRLSPPREVGFEQWGVFVHRGPKGPDRRWIGFLFGDAAVQDGPLGPNDIVSLIGVTRGARPPLMLDGC